MIGLDSNVVVRLLTADDAVQVVRARQLLASCQDKPRSFYLNHVVLAEITWALRTAYGYTRTEIVFALRGLLSLPAFLVEHHELVEAALADYEHGTADFADYLIAAKNLASGCSSTASFDKKAQKIAGVEPI